MGSPLWAALLPCVPRGGRLALSGAAVLTTLVGEHMVEAKDCETKPLDDFCKYMSEQEIWLLFLMSVRVLSHDPKDKARLY